MSPSVASSQSSTARRLPSGLEDHVPEAEVAVDDAGPALRWHPGLQAVVDLVEQRQLARLGLRELGVPALQLAGDVALLAAERAEPDGVRVDGVEPAHHVDEVVGGRATGRRRVRLGVLDRGQHGAVDEVHQVERRPVDGDVLAQPEGVGDRDVGVAQGVDDAVLAAHVVGGLQDVPERRAAQHDRPAGGVDELVREVRAPARDEPAR